MALTGTPAADKAEDIWSILNFLDKNRWSSFWKWGDYYLNKATIWTARGSIEKYSGVKPSKRKELAQELESIAIMYKQKDVLTWLKEPDIIDVPIPPSKEQSKILKELTTMFESGDVIAAGTLDLLAYCRMACSYPQLLWNSCKENPKGEWLLEFLNENESQVIVFSKFKHTLIRLSERINNSLIITGDIKPEQRTNTITKFKNGHGHVLFCQEDIGKEGLTLDNADVIVFYDTPISVNTYEQASARIIPTTVDTARQKTIYRLYLNNTVDKEMIRLIDNKCDEASIINNFKKFIGGDVNEVRANKSSKKKV